LTDSTSPYNSFGNGPAIRVSPIDFTFSTLAEALREAIFPARTGESMDGIRAYPTAEFGYDLNRNLDKPTADCLLRQAFGG
jgi:hypothetical protein